MASPQAVTARKGLGRARTLLLLRACAITLVGFDVAIGLSTSPDPLWLHLLLMGSAAASALTALWRPVLGAALSIIPLASRYLVGEQGYGFVPLIVCTVAVVVTAPRRHAAAVVAGYAAFVASIAVRGPAAGFVSYAVVLATSTAAGVVARLLIHRGRLDEGHIDRLSRTIDQARADERRILAEELAALLVDGLDRNGDALDRALTSREPREAGEVLAAVTASARLALTRLRGLVTTLRLDQVAAAEVAAPQVVRVVEEIEDLLVGYGHPVVVVLPSPVPAVDAEQADLVERCLRDGVEVVLRHGVPGGTCTIELSTAGALVSARLSCPVEGVVDAGALERQQAAVRARGGTLVGTTGPDDDGGAVWSLRVSLSLRERAGLQTILTGLWLIALAAAVWQSAGAMVAASTGQPWLPDALWALTFVASAVVGRLPRLGSALLVIGLVAGLWIASPTASVGEAPQLQIVVLALLCAATRPRVLVAVGLGWIAYVFAWLRGEAGLQLVLLLPYPVVGAMIGFTTRYFSQTRQRHLDQLRRLERERAEARAAERRQLAGELHDIVAHQLSLMSMQAMGPAATSGTSDPDGLLEAVTTMVRLNQATQSDLATLLTLLREDGTAGVQRPGTDSTWSAPSAVAAAVTSTLTGAGYRVDLHVADGVDDCGATTSRTIARVLRECGTNLLRYAPERSRCVIRLFPEAESIVVELANPLPERTRRHPESTGSGLYGLSERALLTGGTFSAGAEGGLWRVRAVVPRWDVPDAGRGED